MKRQSHFPLILKTLDCTVDVNFHYIISLVLKRIFHILFQDLKKSRLQRRHQPISTASLSFLFGVFFGLLSVGKRTCCFCLRQSGFKFHFPCCNFFTLYLTYLNLSYFSIQYLSLIIICFLFKHFYPQKLQNHHQNLFIEIFIII